MEMKGSQTVAATVERTWQALNDPETLKACIPGCETLEPAGENNWTVVMNLKIGPVGARFKGKLALSNVQEPRSYTIQFEGQGGAAGFGKGAADVTLSPVAEGTLLEYGVNAQIGGRIAQVGARLVDAAAKKMADDFFARFNKTVAEAAADAGTGAVPAERAAGTGQAADAEQVSDASVPGALAAVAEATSNGALPPAADAPAAPPVVPVSSASGAGTSGAAQSGTDAPSLAPGASGKPAWIWWLLAIIVVFVLYLMFRG